MPERAWRREDQPDARRVPGLAAHIDAPRRHPPPGRIVRVQHRLGRRWSQWPLPCLNCGKPPTPATTPACLSTPTAPNKHCPPNMLDLASEWKFAGVSPMGERFVTRQGCWYRPMR